MTMSPGEHVPNQTRRQPSKVPEAETVSPTASWEGRLVAEDEGMDFRAAGRRSSKDSSTIPQRGQRRRYLVAEVLQRLSTTFENQHQELEEQGADGEPSTEVLRGALWRYHDFL